MAVLLKTASVRVSFIQIMQVRVQNKCKSVWKSRYDGDVTANIIGMLVEQSVVATRVIINLGNDTSPYITF